VTSTADVRALLATAVERTALDGHDGRSGSVLERVVLPGTGTLVVKRSRPDTDLTALVTGDAGRELALLGSGALDRLPAGVGHALLAGWRAGQEIVLVMRDVGASIPGWSRLLDRAESARILDAAAAVHRRFADDRPDGLCTTRATALWPHRMRPLAGGPNPLPGLVLRGWDRFAELVPAPVVDRVRRLQRDPTPLLDALGGRAPTLLHGDLWPVNLALEPAQVTLLDWSLASWGPPLLEFAVLLTGTLSRVRADPADVLADVRAAGALPAADTDLMLAVGLLELGWNKALDAAEHPDPATRAAERRALDWWVDAAGPGLSALTS
jgi:hypothetical protein